jgi:hypothetical protein
MSKERIILTDGVLDISGLYICSTYKEPEEETIVPLPYTVQDLTGAKPPAQFLNFLESIFSDEKTAETVLNYLSLIISKHTKFKYGGIFIGPPRRKMILLKILSNALPGYIKFFSFSDLRIGPSDLAKMDGLGAAVIEGASGDACIKTVEYKRIISNGSLTAMRPGHDPYQFTPTAQIIITDDHFPQFDKMPDKTLADQIVAVPFSAPHPPGKPKTISLGKIIKSLPEEYPGIIKLLADYYVNLKRRFNGIIPLSKQCKGLKTEHLKTFFINCKHCKEHFYFADVVIKDNQLHCPHCGTVIKTTQAHVSRRGK